MHNHVLKDLKNTVAKYPDKPAFCGEKSCLTFRQLDTAVDRIGTYILRQGIKKSPIVVYMEKSPEEVAAFFGIIRAGSYYVPIDAEMPPVRIHLILENVKSPLLICDDATAESAEELGFGGKIIKYSEIAGPALEGISGESEADNGIDTAALDEVYHHSIDTDPLYIVFTSGSTGVPKGVVGCHRAVNDYIDQLSEVLGFSSETVFGNQTPLYLDACFKELYPTIRFGATTYFVPKSLFMQPLKLVQYLNEHKINTVCWVVSALTIISAFGTFKTEIPKYLKTIAFGSEVFPLKQFRMWRTALPEATFTNLYGPTEGTGMCCYYRVDRDFEDGEAIPIGRPFDNTDIILLDDENNEVTKESGEQGEICIRGTSLTLGYMNNPEKTAEAFTINPLQKGWPELIYRTGDIGRYNERGELMFVSRKDFQIKHMGHRIELGEIEVNAQMIEGITGAACVYDKAKGKIVLFYSGDKEEADMKVILKDSLPRYMVPNVTKKLDRIPLTSNGKTDRVALSGMI
ncbi:MAG: amino acid adenylation domain-containing protein [Saccharofermentanaceae bacterium]|nr:amino acid adenylation domain-containing protein [Saccharofermentanaceae bacterium]